MGSSGAIAAYRRILLIDQDGNQFANAMNVLHDAGFRGEAWGVTHGEWAPILQGRCARVLPLPDSNTPRKRRAVALLRILLGNRGRVDAIVWTCPPRGHLGRIARALTAGRPVYCFHHGQPEREDPRKKPGPPSIEHGGPREQEVALRHLGPLLAQATKAAPTLCLGIDGDVLHTREATGVPWVRRHLFAALCAEELGIDLRVVAPVAEARSVWEMPWSRRMRRVPPAIAAYMPPDRERATPIEAVTGPIDLFHQTLFDPPRFRFKKVVATVHDVTPLALPDAFPDRFRERLHAIAPFWRDECARLICVSEATRNDLEAYLNIPKSRTVCIPNGRHPHFAPREAAEVETALARYGIEAPYFMALGAIAPHKNLRRLCEAFARVQANTDAPHQLVIVGPSGWMTREVLEGVGKSGVADRIRFTGYADWCDLPALYSGATAFCMPSLYEGYGLPVQEAMCCGCPVLVSNRSSLPEVAGDAGTYWDPEDTDSMAEAMLKAANSEREAPSARVLAHAGTFPAWRDVALAHRRVYDEVLADG